MKTEANVYYVTKQQLNKIIYISANVSQAAQRDFTLMQVLKYVYLAILCALIVSLDQMIAINVNREYSWIPINVFRHVPQVNMLMQQTNAYLVILAARLVRVLMHMIVYLAKTAIRKF